MDLRGDADGRVHALEFGLRGDGLGDGGLLHRGLGELLRLVRALCRELFGSVSHVLGQGRGLRRLGAPGAAGLRTGQRSGVVTGLIDVLGSGGKRLGLVGGRDVSGGRGWN
ncbi:hypothetical protein SBI_02449 [Streptomyces bingchenggensis BCW-1]|uniref:Uncharacterized protein n=1 Tax=Streptomyces bingchenggensis (strain BCW-1) TaxID=749414 RepID=D7BX25_STRBB|nr:hypothetical protein SBI_02449 [Streptomyces bingchenggensis BCW-1]